MHKRLTALVLALLLMSMTVAGCSGGDSPQSESTSSADTTQTPSESDGEPAQTDREDIKDGVPELNFDGKPFRVLHHDGTNYLRDIVAEEENGDIVNDAVFERNRMVEERLGIVITPVPVGSGSMDVINAARTATLAGDDSYDLIVGHAIRTAVGVTENLFVDWNTLPYIDTSRPWWSQSAVEQLSVGDHAYLLCGDYSTITLGTTYCMYFNKTIGTNYGYTTDDMYSMVLDGDWTLDRMGTVIKDFEIDLNGDGAMDDSDMYGLSTTTESAAVAYQWAFDAPMTKRSSDGYPELNLDYEKWSSIVNSLYSLYYENGGTYVYTSAADDALFRNGQAFMYNNTFGKAFDFRDLEIDYGIIPYPKYNDAQETYKSMADGGHTLFAVSKAATDYELIGAATELLNAESYRRVVPAYYETALKVKYARDAESVQIMDMILENCTFDFGYFYDNWTGFAFMLQDMMRSKSSDFASYYAKREAAAINQFETVMEAVDSLEG